ncbi:hypothetical protein UR09_06185 [Candidatus Nitromaritima sp. SCGC AAA799-A02]|nr:hypothetical protein UR09_06185 [Candidatus Nitromaritima sp. SCGC AAA799-A02]KMP11750.1 hypothetical protein UZ36_03215 [Candidatus Nitromaritima sp. SCGC AAA799-C22]
MKNFFLTLHMISMCLVVGTLFLQSLTVVFRLRLKKQEEVEGARNIQKRIHKFIYYPILAVTIISGMVLAAKTGVFGQASWIVVKLGLLIVLIVLGVLNGRQIQTDALPKKYAMMVHIAIFLIGAGMIYLATIKPF